MSSLTSQDRISRAEIGAIAAFTCFALLLRTTNLLSAGLSHFDEGVYTLWGLTGDYPAKQFFAPPLYPFLINLLSSLFWPSDIWGPVVSAVSGSVTVPLVWWLARRWYGPVAGLTSAALSAFSGLHVAISRMALTDALFTCLFVLGIVLAQEAFFADLGQSHAAENRSPLRSSTMWRSPWIISLAAGLVLGAAVNTKYNGILLAVFVVAATGFGVVTGFFHFRAIARRMPRIALFIAIGAVLYVPWFLHVHSKSGYGALLAHHRGYAEEWTQWVDNVRTLLAAQWYLGRWTHFVGPAIGVLSAMVYRGGAVDAAAVTLLGVASIVSMLCGDGIFWALGPIVALLAVRRGGASGIALHLIWLGGLILLTPHYRPYVRLVLPLAVVGWISFGAFVSLILDRFSNSVLVARWRIGWLAVVLASCLGSVGFFWRALLPQQRADRPAPDLRSVGQSLAASIPAGVRVASYVRPPAFLYVSGPGILEPHDPANAPSLDYVFRPSTGPGLVLIDHALLRDNPRLRDQLARSQGWLEEAERAAYRPNEVVLLDDFGRACLSMELEPLVQATYQLVLYRKKPPP